MWNACLLADGQIIDSAPHHHLKVPALQSKRRRTRFDEGSARKGERNHKLKMTRQASRRTTIACLVIAALSCDEIVLAFPLHPHVTGSFSLSSPSSTYLSQRSRACRRIPSSLRAFYNDFGEDDDDDEDDDEIDLDSLGDWRDFRRSLNLQQEEEVGDGSKKEVKTKRLPKLVSKENEQLLRSQSETLAEEYVSGVWAHETSTVRFKDSGDSHS